MEKSSRVITWEQRNEIDLCLSRAREELTLLETIVGHWPNILCDFDELSEGFNSVISNSKQRIDDVMSLISPEK